MSWLHESIARLKELFGKRHHDARLDAELQTHLALLIEQNIARGMSPEAARRAAKMSLGGAAQIREYVHDHRGIPFLETLYQDVRFALRMLRKSPGFTAVAVLTLALGIGATTAIFSVVDATILHPLAFPQPQQLVRLEDNLSGVGAGDVGMSVPEWKDMQNSGIFEYVSPTVFADANLTGSSQPARIRFLGVAPNYFALLGVKPEVGRVFDPQDSRRGFLMEVVISDGLWKSAFGADPRILDKSLRLDNDLYRIIGVMPPGFHDPGRTSEERSIQVWAALGFAAAPFPDPPLRNVRLLPSAIARLQPTMTLKAAQSRLNALVAALQGEFPANYPSKSAWTVRLVPLKESIVGNVRQSLVLLLGAVGLVLLIGCVNVANLLLARASARGREMAVRQALGAARARLIRQLLTESLLLSLLGGISGLMILFCTKGLLLRAIPSSLPRLNQISINWLVLLFAFVACVLAGAIFGLAPALLAGRLDLVRILKREGRSSTGSGDHVRIRRTLVIAEVALSLVLMIAASLLLLSFRNLLNVRLGFNPQNVMAVRLWLPVPNDPKADIYKTAAQEAPLIRELLRRSKTLPGVSQVALGDRASIPLDHVRTVAPVILEGRDTLGGLPPSIERSTVTFGYFHLMDISLLRGRLFNDSDDEKAQPVVVINESFAQTYFPNENPIGKRLKLFSATLPWNTIVGVVANARTESLGEVASPHIYANLFTLTAKDLSIFLRGRLDRSAIPVETRHEVQTVNPELPVFGAQTLNEALSGSLSERRFSMEMIALFALTALLLAAIGIYGVISYMVGERTHEIGIRVALGAQQSRIMGMVLRQGLILAVAGVAIGVAVALIASHVMAGLLYGVTPADPLAFAGVAVLLLLVATAACYIPARRATKVDPMVALRYE